MALKYITLSAMYVYVHVHCHGFVCSPCTVYIYTHGELTGKNTEY